MSKQYDLSFNYFGLDVEAVADEAGAILSMQVADDNGSWVDYTAKPGDDILAKASEALIQAKVEAYERSLRLAPIMTRMKARY